MKENSRREFYETRGNNGGEVDIHLALGLKPLQNPIKDKGRFLGALIYYILAIFILFILPHYLKINLIYTKSIDDFSNYPRFLWSLAFSFFGFSMIAFRASEKEHPDSPAWKSYPTIYLVNLIIISSLVFAILHISNQTSNYLFYFFSSPICFMLSYYIDSLLKSPLDLLKSIK